MKASEYFLKLKYKGDTLDKLKELDKNFISKQEHKKALWSLTNKFTDTFNKQMNENIKLKKELSDLEEDGANKVLDLMIERDDLKKELEKKDKRIKKLKEKK